MGILSSEGRWKRYAQTSIVLVCALALKLFYSTASPDQLRWILAPTTTVVELFSGVQFSFESHAGYMSSDHSFLIAASCAGVNFLVTAFLMLALRKVWDDQRASWKWIPASATLAYAATLVANTMRIDIALKMHETRLRLGGFSPAQLHRLEGILVYFGFLLLLFFVSEGWSTRRLIANQAGSRQHTGLTRVVLFPALVYYSVTLLIPLANGAYRQGAQFWRHSLFVILIPLLLLIPFAALYKRWTSHTRQSLRRPDPSASERCLRPQDTSVST